MANFTPPFDTTVFLPSKSDLTKWIYDIWVYLRDNPIVSEETVASIIDDYFEKNPISFPVQSVNGQTGKVTLKAADVGALPNTYTAPVQSVNAQTGIVTLKAADVGALPDTYIAPVQSVNGQTGNVNLTADNVGALPNSYTPPVNSVNGAVGNVMVNQIHSYNGDARLDLFNGPAVGFRLYFNNLQDYLDITLNTINGVLSAYQNSGKGGNIYSTNNKPYISLNLYAMFDGESAAHYVNRSQLPGFTGNIYTIVYIGTIGQPTIFSLYSITADKIYFKLYNPNGTLIDTNNYSVAVTYLL